jgi:hypothetical protein
MLAAPSQKALYLGGGCNGAQPSFDHLCLSSFLSDLWLGNVDATTGGF